MEIEIGKLVRTGKDIGIFDCDIRGITTGPTRPETPASEPERYARFQTIIFALKDHARS
jgi:hypothetical protein